MAVTETWLHPCVDNCEIFPNSSDHKSEFVHKVRGDGGLLPIRNDVYSEVMK